MFCDVIVYQLILLKTNWDEQARQAFKRIGAKLSVSERNRPDEKTGARCKHCTVAQHETQRSRQSLNCTDERLFSCSSPRNIAFMSSISTISTLISAVLSDSAASRRQQRRGGTVLHLGARTTPQNLLHLPGPADRGQAVRGVYEGRPGRSVPQRSRPPQTPGPRAIWPDPHGGHPVSSVHPCAGTHH